MGTSFRQISTHPLNPALRVAGHRCSLALPGYGLGCLLGFFPADSDDGSMFYFSDIRIIGLRDPVR
jgi:hypothetical protein